MPPERVSAGSAACVAARSSSILSRQRMRSGSTSQGRASEKHPGSYVMAREAISTPGGVATWNPGMLPA
jgi:hypothetical protein